MPPSILGILQSISRCAPRQHSRSVRGGPSKTTRLLHFFGLAVVFLASRIPLMAQLVQVPAISTVAGIPGSPGTSGNGGPATSAQLLFPASAAFDRAGNLYVLDAGADNIRKIAASTGIITTVAGNGTIGFSGDGGAATSAEFFALAAIALDSAGNLYIADASNNRIRKVNATTGIISTVAGNGSATTSGDGGPATNAGLVYPQGIALDSAGDIFVTDNGVRGVREINATTGIISTVIGNGATPSPGFVSLFGVAFDGSGNLFIGDNGNHKVFKLTAATGTLSVVAGNGTAGSTGDGGAANSAELNWPQSLAFDGGGNLYISDEESNNVRKVSATTGIITTVAGNGTAGYSGDYGAAVNAELNNPGAVALDSAGNLYIPDGLNSAVRKVGLLTFPPTNVSESNGPFALILQTTSAETISSLTVPSSQGNKKEYSIYGVTGCAVDGVTSIAAGTNCQVEIIFDPAYPGLRSVPLQAVTSAGKVNVGLNGMGVAPLVAITPGTMSTIGGELNPPNCNAYSGPAVQGPLCNPSAGAVDAAGNVYVAAFYSNTVSRIDTSGNVTVIAGTGAGGVSGIGGLATSANIERPADVVVDAAGNVYFADESAQQVFRIDAITQILTSVAGNGTQGYGGDNGPASMASLNRPEGVAIDAQGNLYIEDQDNNLIRKVNPFGIITTVVGNPASIGQGLPAYGGDGGPATQANLDLCCSGVYASYDSIGVDAAGDLFIGDSGHHVVREVTTDGIIHTIAGNNTLGAGFSGDGGAATSAQLNWPMGVATDPGGDVYIADFANNRIRKVDAATQTITTVAGDGTTGSPSSGLATQVDLNGPQKVALDGMGNLYVADTKNNLVRETNVSNPTLTFVTPTAVGSTDTTDGPLGVVVSNIGNAPLTLPPPATGTNASVTAGFSFFIGESGPCPAEGPSSSAGTLGQGSSCGLTVEFTPASVGSVTGSIVLTDNSLNAPSPYVTQTISLIGTGLASTTGALTIAPTTQMFPSTAVGSTSSAVTSTITNSTSKAVYISAGSLTDAVDFTQKDNCTGIIAANTGTCTVTFTFTPQSAGALTSTYAIHDLDHPESPLTVALSGNGTAVATPQATLSPSSADFGSVTTGTTSSSQIFTLSNTGTTALGIASISLSGANPGSFSIATDNCATGAVASATPAHSLASARGQAKASDIPSLPSARACQIILVFSPTSAGAFAATLTIVDDAGTQTSTLTGIGVAPAPPAAPVAALTPASADFGSMATGTASAAKTFTLTNSGNATLSISGITLAGTNASDFAITTNGCSETLAASATCSITVTFTPSTTGGFAATLSVADNATGSPHTSTLTGTGTSPADFTIAASPSAQSVSAGGLIAYTVTVTSADGSFTNPVALTASGLPSGASVSFSPASVTPGSSAAESNMAIQTVRQQASAKNGHPHWPFEAPVLAALLLLLPGKKWRSRRSFMNLACFFALLGIAASTIGCGGGFALPSTAKTYTITVTGTSGSDTHSTTVTLTVQ